MDAGRKATIHPYYLATTIVCILAFILRLGCIHSHLRMYVAHTSPSYVERLLVLFHTLTPGCSTDLLLKIRRENPTCCARAPPLSLSLSLLLFRKMPAYIHLDTRDTFLWPPQQTNYFLLTPQRPTQPSPSYSFLPPVENPRYLVTADGGWPSAVPVVGPAELNKLRRKEQLRSGDRTLPYCVVGTPTSCFSLRTENDDATEPMQISSRSRG